MSLQYRTVTVPIPVGWSWKGRTTGRPWTTTGAALTLTASLWVPPWDQLAELLRPLFEPEGWNVHALPPDSIAAPAVVIDAADDWQAPLGFFTPAWAFEVHLIVQRGNAAEGLLRLGKASVLVREAIRGSGFAWVLAEKPTQEGIAGTEFLETMIGIGIMQQDPNLAPIERI